MMSKRSITQTDNAFEEGNKTSNIDPSKTGTEGNYSLVKFDTLKDIKVDKKWITFDRRGNRKQSYAEALTGNNIYGG